jgi:ABC-type Fe3+-siderophore transport system permease subunit
MRNKFVVALAVVFTFAVISLLMIKLLPEPHADFDFMLTGTVATLVSMLVLFLMLIGPRLKSGGVFVKRRRKR